MNEHINQISSKKRNILHFTERAVILFMLLKYYEHGDHYRLCEHLEKNQNTWAFEMFIR